MYETAHLLAHLRDLARRSQKEGRSLSSAFLSEEECEIAQEAFRGEPGFSLEGGYPDAIRKRACFTPSWEEPILPPVYWISLHGASFAKDLTHRHYLGSILGSGIKRECIGDILVKDNGAYVFAIESVEGEILNLTRIGNTTVDVRRVQNSAVDYVPSLETRRIALSSLRLDAFVSEAFSLSRTEAKKAIELGLVTHKGMEATKPEKEVQIGDNISMRRKGKVRISDIPGTSKKGKWIVEITIRS